jgi:SAM-dependent methyltransferase
MRVNLGCGHYPFHGWTNVDLPPLADDPRAPTLDVVDFVAADVRDGLPFESGSVDRIYAGHVLEHISRDDLPRALTELRRVLADDGQMLVVGPDINLAVALNCGQDVLDDIRGRQPEPGEARPAWGWPEQGHAWIPTGAETTIWLAAAGFDVDEADIRTIQDGWPIVSRARWQFALSCRKAASASVG